MQALGYLTPSSFEPRSRPAKRRQVAQHGLRILDGGAEARADLRQKADALPRERAPAPTLPDVPLVAASVALAAAPVIAGRHRR